METLDLYRNAIEEHKMITFLNESKEVISIEPHLIWQDKLTDDYHCTCYMHREDKEIEDVTRISGKIFNLSVDSTVADSSLNYILNQITYKDDNSSTKSK